MPGISCGSNASPAPEAGPGPLPSQTGPEGARGEAARLARFFGTCPDLWLNLQTHYDMKKARDEGLFVRVEEDVRPWENPKL